jgi:hypothetical protein
MEYDSQTSCDVYQASKLLALYCRFSRVDSVPVSRRKFSFDQDWDEGVKAPRQTGQLDLLPGALLEALDHV